MAIYQFGRLRSTKEAADTIEKAKGFGVPVSILGLCESIGFSVFQKPLSEDILGCIVKNHRSEKTGENECMIVVNKNIPQEWKRFAIAHELGYYIHFNTCDAPEFHHVYCRGYEENWSLLEPVVIRFADELLMPEMYIEGEYECVLERSAGLDDP